MSERLRSDGRNGDDTAGPPLPERYPRLALIIRRGLEGYYDQQAAEQAEKREARRQRRAG